eukprot:2746123-Rhodomonas_salina.3
MESEACFKTGDAVWSLKTRVVEAQLRYVPEQSRFGTGGRRYWSRPFGAIHPRGLDPPHSLGQYWAARSTRAACHRRNGLCQYWTSLCQLRAVPDIAQHDRVGLYRTLPTPRNQIQETAFLVQDVLRLRFLVFDFGGGVAYSISARYRYDLPVPDSTAYLGQSYRLFRTTGPPF